jgi:predicted double-glycine peptidase
MLETLLSLLLALGEVRDRESLRFLYCSEQLCDSSCGLAALSSLMGIYWGFPVDEYTLAIETFGARASEGDYRVSFGDLKRLLELHGFAARAYGMDLDQLRAAMRYAPLVAHYDRPDGHFVLILSFEGETVVTADPAEGVVARGMDAFLARWSGKVLLAARPGSVARPEQMARAKAAALGRASLLEDEGARSRLGPRGVPLGAPR